MPLLDVSFVTADPMLADTFQVTRRTDQVDQKGRTTPTPAEVFSCVTGVVTQQSPADLMRLPDGQTVPRRIFIASCFAFRGASLDEQAQGYQPDLITWNNNDYLVTEVLPYSRFGHGVYEIIATSIKATARADTRED